MKYLLPGLLVILVFICSCSKKENIKLEASVTTTYAFYLDSAWEVNLSTKVTGFKQEASIDKFKSSISYTIDIIKPGGVTVRGLVSKTEDKIDKEKLPDIILDSQFDLDASYKPGKYAIVINLKDMVTGQTATAKKDLDLSAE
jgi:PBP1b-binding outer membrane lipoprotein LpoB